MMSPILFLLVLSLATLSQSASLNQRLSGELSNMSVSESIEQANENMTDVMIDGDIMGEPVSNAVPCTSGGCLWPKTGRFIDLPYIISSDFSKEQRDFIISVLITFRRLTCIRFIPRTTQSDYINFFSGNGCWSFLGRQGGQQLVSLNETRCLRKGTVQHEVLHALGFHHEHVRSDRNKFVEILFQNIIPGRESNFRIQPTNNLGTPYDFFSVLHYHNREFSRNGLPTIVAKGDPNMQFGNALEMNQNDIDRVNRLYKCSKLTVRSHCSS